jgi:photosystem II stability/assembly factor-like uncharacterized protein
MKQIGLIMMTTVLMAIPVNSQHYNHVEVETVLSLNKEIYCHSIYAPNDSAVWADFASEIYRSIDGGKSWTQIMNPDPVEWTSLRPLNTDTAFYSAMYSGFYKTTDGGKTWENMNKAENHPNHFHFFDINEGVVVEIRFDPPGDPNGERELKIWKTSDGGYTWIEVIEPDRPAFLPNEGAWHHANNMHRQTIGDTIFFGTSMGRVFRSFDRGNTWEAFYTGLEGGQFIMSMAHHGTKNMMVMSDGLDWGSSSKSSFTNDGGITWTTNSLESGSTGVAAIPGKDSCFLLLKGYYNLSTGLSITHDGGNTFSELNLLSDMPCHTITFINDSVAIMPSLYFKQDEGPDSDYIYRLTFSYKNDITTIIESNSGVFRVYPNPAKDILTIETNNLGQQSVEISSLKGQLIYSTNMEGTTHQIDLSSFQKGFYFISIRSKDFVATEKIIKL